MLGKEWRKKEKRRRLASDKRSSFFLSGKTFFVDFPIPYCLSKDEKEEKAIAEATEGL